MFVYCFFLLAITQSSLSVYCQKKIASPSFTSINTDLYHSSDSLLEQLKDLSERHPEKLVMETYETGDKDYSANVTVVTYCQDSYKIHDMSMFRVLLSFGQHGRELITSELAWAILSLLSREHFLPHFDPLVLEGTLDRIVIKVVPIENLNGRKLVEAGNTCERRNGRGVDLNRNWSVDWGIKEKDYDPYEENPGKGPFSEPETQIMRKIAVSFKPHIWVNVHSGMEALFMPYDHKNTTLDGLPFQNMKLLLEEINRLHCHNRCIVGSGGGSVGYLAHGTATDYMYDLVKVPMAFTFEIYGNESASPKDCFKMFNPTDLNTFNKVIDGWCGAFFTLFKLGSRLAPQLRKKGDAVDDEYVDGYLMEERTGSRYGKKKREMVEFGMMQEMRTYFRLLLLSSVLIIFMFCTRISSKSKWNNRPIAI